jgi:hypothetical protein
MGYLVRGDHPSTRTPGKATAPRAITIGIDVGQRRDPTAIVVADAVGEPQGYDVLWSYTARHLERLPLGTDYETVAARLKQVVQRVADHPERQGPIAVIVDATGVGLPVVDILRRTLAGSPASLTAAMFTHGYRLNGVIGDKEIGVGKAYLVSTLQSLFQTGRIQLPAKHPEAHAMVRELQDYEIRVDDDAHDRYGAFKTGTHDDLVTALGLAVISSPVKPYTRYR